MDYLLPPRSQEHVDELHTRASAPGDAPVSEDPWARDYRSPAQHDRDRILYSSWFQRLAYVTQVTAPESGHIFHNRLTHSLKVAQVGRRNAERLLALADQGHLDGAARDLVMSLHADAVEASCLAHDLGHPPFGHIAEEILNKSAREHVGDDGGFEGNAQSFRIVTRLAERASGSGLDLTMQTLDGVLKYPWRWWREDPQDRRREQKWGYYLVDHDAFEFARKHAPPENDEGVPLPSLEALIMEWADDLTYAVHDVDDFFRAGLIPLHRLAHQDDDESKRLRDLFESAKEAAPRSWPSYSVDEMMDAVRNVAQGAGPTGAYRHTADLRREMRAFGSELITRYLGAFRVENAAEGRVRVFVPDEIDREVEALKLLVRVYVIRRPGLAVVQHGQQGVIRDLFEEYFRASNSEATGDRRLFPPGAKEVLDLGGNDPAARARVVVDLLAGLTENAAVQLHQRLVGGTSAPTLDATAQMG